MKAYAQVQPRGPTDPARLSVIEKLLAVFVQALNVMWARLSVEGVSSLAGKRDPPPARPETIVELICLSSIKAHTRAVIIT